MSAPDKIKFEANMDFDETATEANNLLKNGILVETSKGLICMSLNDALSSDLNLSVEDLKNVATQLILQQNVKETRPFQTNFNFDSDGFSSECSDVSTTTASSLQSTSTTYSPLSYDVLAQAGRSQNIMNCPKIVSIASVTRTTISEKSTIIEPQPIKQVVSEGKDIVNPPVGMILQPLSTASTLEPAKPKKGRGGWPKGRKRKPELLNLPPKAPATGYNLYLNEQRELFKGSTLAFHEITKIVGNRWSSLSLLDKQPYLDRAEEDKKRYREELKQYRQSDAYRTYLAKKRKKRLQNNVLSESDMDATDEIDDEDNEELYCRTCDQWFHNLHNKREHLQGRQHLQSVAGDIHRELISDGETNVISTTSFSTSLDESSLDAIPHLKSLKSNITSSMSIYDAMANLVTLVARRQAETKLLQKKKEESSQQQEALCRILVSLNERHNTLRSKLAKLKEDEKEMENRAYLLWQVPSWFVIKDLSKSDAIDENEGTE